MQILLKIEDLIQQQNQAVIKTPIDDDDVWEVANLIRWLNQLFKEKFKIEKFLFGEIYSNYYLNSPEFVVSLMEELGYDNSQNDDDTDENNGDDTNNESDSVSDNKKILNNDDSIVSNASSSNLNSSDVSYDATRNPRNDSINNKNNDNDLLNESRRKKL